MKTHCHTGKLSTDGRRAGKVIKDLLCCPEMLNFVHQLSNISIHMIHIIERKNAFDAGTL